MDILDDELTVSKSNKSFLENIRSSIISKDGEKKEGTMSQIFEFGPFSSSNRVRSPSMTRPPGHFSSIEYEGDEEDRRVVKKLNVLASKSTRPARIDLSKSKSQPPIKLMKSMGKSALIKNNSSNGKGPWWEISDTLLTKEELISEGSYGCVWRGRYCGRYVAIKELVPMRGVQTLFEKELKMLCTVKSHYIAKFIGVVPDKRLIVFEYYPKGSLFQLMKSSVELQYSDLITLTEDMCNGLHTLHSYDPQILHGDFKPHNLLINMENGRMRAKITDFGGSRFVVSENLNTLRKPHGTLQYLAPELFHSRVGTTKVDMYSFGVVLWELLQRFAHGRYVPVYADIVETAVDSFDFLEFAHHIGKLNKRPPIPEKFNSLIEENLYYIAQSCWAVVPEHRPDTSRALLMMEHFLLYSTNLNAVVPTDDVLSSNSAQNTPIGSSGTNSTGSSASQPSSRRSTENGTEPVTEHVWNLEGSSVPSLKSMVIFKLERNIATGRVDTRQLLEIFSKAFENNFEELLVFSKQIIVKQFPIIRTTEHFRKLPEKQQEHLGFSYKRSKMYS